MEVVCVRFASVLGYDLGENSRELGIENESCEKYIQI